MSDPRINPNYRGVRCPGCGEYLPSMLTDLCSYCQHQKDKATIERLEANNSILREAIEYYAIPGVIRGGGRLARNALAVLDSKEHTCPCDDGFPTLCSKHKPVDSKEQTDE